MPSKKKTNYISYELKRLEKYLKQLQQYLDDNPPDKMEDRIEEMVSTKGNPIIKVIASKEQQLKCFMEILKQMPPLLEDINKLRMAVDGEEEEDEVRGGHDIPGFMRKKKGPSALPRKKEEVEINEHFDDDPLEHSVENSVTRYLPGPEELEAAKDLDAEPDEDEMEDYDPWDEQ